MTIKWFGVVGTAVLGCWFVVPGSVLRAQQLMKGCIPHLDGVHKATTMAQMEVSAGKIARKAEDSPADV